ncbi:MAG TPA: ATP phosphoribosyltransferase regulatory subunit [Leptospiraceae bacterium]|nr:ATP phosphoribosyltransferase regulatory subunit [Leptospiraceae bacterium]
MKTRLKNHLQNSTELKWIPDGFHFLGPEESAKRRNLLNLLHGYFNEKGFLEIQMPTFDFTSSFQNHVNPAEHGKFFKIKDGYGNEISPSHDLTLQAVKGMAGFGEKKGNYRLYYISKIWKDQSQYNGARREFLQAGAEIIGHSNEGTFKLILKILDEIFELISFKKKITIVLGNILPFYYIAEKLKLNAQEKETLTRLMYSKDTEEIRNFLSGKKGSRDIFDILHHLLFSYSFREILPALLILEGKFGFPLKNCIKETEELLKFSENMKSIEICPDFSLVRDMDYYTGFVFQGYAGRLSFPLVQGGAYDRLFQKFTGEEKNACGFSLNIDIIEELIREEQ